MSNYADRTAKYVYFAGTLDAAVWGAELAAGDGRQRIYVVEPEGGFEDDPNVTDKKIVFIAGVERDRKGISQFAGMKQEG